jgi:hypothetical protein
MLIRPLEPAIRPGLDSRGWLPLRALSIPFWDLITLYDSGAAISKAGKINRLILSTASSSTRRCVGQRNGGVNGGPARGGKNFEEVDDSGRCRRPKRMMIASRSRKTILIVTLLAEIMVEEMMGRRLGLIPRGSSPYLLAAVSLENEP